ncbi:uncharacterized protein LOC144581918 isoform X2 [Callithrix jacchus]
MKGRPRKETSGGGILAEAARNLCLGPVPRVYSGIQNRIGRGVQRAQRSPRISPSSGSLGDPLIPEPLAGRKVAGVSAAHVCS